MDPGEWSEWRALNPRLTYAATEPAERPCADCPLGYAAEMRAVGRCNGTPGWVAEEDEVSDAPRLLTGGKEVPVALSLPCDRCAHYRVCAIRPVMEARLETLPVSLPVLDSAVKVTLSADVECGHFLRAAKAAGAPTAIRTRSPETRAKMAAAQQARAERIRAEREAASA